MTLHEARLPECSREMMRTGNFLIPTSGGRPWLERPPLPHWIMIGVAEVLGQQCDSEWSVRIPPALCGLLIVLMTASIAARWFGNGAGVAAGLMLATMYEFYHYSTLSEDDIFLALVVVAAIACFIWMEFVADPEARAARWNPIGRRPWPVICFFILLGLTNLAKGPLVGAAVVAGPIGAFLLWQGDARRACRYLWVWGMLAAVAIGLSWHLLAQHRYPEYAENLRFDFSDTEAFDNPFYYYPLTLLLVALPWSPAALAGLRVTAASAWKERSPILRFLWCWAIVPIIVLSIPHRKHHHYLVPSLAPWAILAAIGAQPMALEMFRGIAFTRKPRFGLLVFGLPILIVLIVLTLKHKIPGPLPVSILLMAVWLACVWIFYHGLWTRNPRWLLAAILLGVGVAFSWGQTWWPNDTVDDTNMLHRVNAIVPADKPLLVNSAVGPLDFFRLQFYLRGDAGLIHNLSYLRSTDLAVPDVYVVGRLHDLSALQTLGEVQVVLQSPHSHLESGPGDRFALFHLEFAPGLVRFAPPPVSPMQAMQRKPGPWCGPPLPEPK
jgi:hypothetical protein